MGWPSGPVQRKVTRVNLYGSIQRTQTNQPTMDPSTPLPVDQAPDEPSDDNDGPPYLVANSANIPNITARPGPLSKLTLPQAQVGNKCTTWANVKFTSGGQEYDFIQTKALVCSTTGPEKTFYRMAIPTALYNVVCQAATLGSDMYMNDPNVQDEDWTQVVVDHKKWKVAGLQHAVRVAYDNSTTTGSMQSILARLASAEPKQHLEVGCMVKFTLSCTQEAWVDHISSGMWKVGMSVVNAYCRNVYKGGLFKGSAGRVPTGRATQCMPELGEILAELNFIGREPEVESENSV